MSLSHLLLKKLLCKSKCHVWLPSAPSSPAAASRGCESTVFLCKKCQRGFVSGEAFWKIL